MASDFKRCAMLHESGSDRVHFSVQAIQQVICTFLRPDPNPLWLFLWSCERNLLSRSISCQMLGCAARQRDNIVRVGSCIVSVGTLPCRLLCSE
jgi:hypothetical protein